VTLIELQNSLKQQIRETALLRWGVTLENLNAEVPPRPDLGDLAFPVAFELAKLIKQATGNKLPPRTIAEELKPSLLELPAVRRVEVAGPGYINVFFDRAMLLSALSSLTQPQTAAVVDDNRPKKMVEHTSINPNKAAHIGHVRNSVLGDTFVRILRAANERVEVQNYIDNTGVQVADVVVGFIHLENMSLDKIKELDRSLKESFDYYCWDLYTRVGLFYRDGDPNGDSNPEKLKLRSDVLHALEEGNNAIAELADYVASRNVECILDTMERLDIRYDLLARESDILGLHFWERAFQLMKEKGVIRLETEGRSKGCWVMPFESHTGTDEHEADKIIVRSNGTVTYTGKDIAYQLWKLGHLGLDFNYQPFRRYSDGHIAWVTSTKPNSNALPEVPRPNFGGGVAVYNVIDSRQSYPQEIVAQGVCALVPELGKDASVHFGYEKVALSPAACEELGIQLSDEDRSRPFIEMSGRKGVGVKADDLIDRLESSALAEVSSRNPDLADDQQEKIAHSIAVGALRYFLLKFTRNSVIAFDFKEALAFEGETGTYCQNAAVRANSIFRKLGEEPFNSARDFMALVSTDKEAAAGVLAFLETEPGTEVWTLVTLAARLPEIVAQAASSAEPANLAKYAFTLARSFNLFYHRHRIIAEEDETKKAIITVAADIARRQLTSALAILGITVPDRM